MYKTLPYALNNLSCDFLIVSVWEIDKNCIEKLKNGKIKYENMSFHTKMNKLDNALPHFAGGNFSNGFKFTEFQDQQKISSTQKD